MKARPPSRQPAPRPVDEVVGRILVLLSQRGPLSPDCVIAELGIATLDAKLACYELLRAGWIKPPPTKRNGRPVYRRQDMLYLATGRGGDTHLGRGPRIGASA